jgi:hypothetical protein
MNWQSGALQAQVYQACTPPQAAYTLYSTCSSAIQMQTCQQGRPAMRRLSVGAMCVAAAFSKWVATECPSQSL